MLAYVLKRLAGAVPTLLLLAALAFILMHAAPGGPFDAERALAPEIEAQLRAQYQLDEPLPVQFGHYLWGLAQGDFGPSFHYTDYSVGELIAMGFPVSATVGLASLLLALLLGGSMGVIAALRHNRFTDRLLMGLAISGLCVPVFVIGPVLVLVFAIYAGWLPAGGWSNGDLSHLILPIITLALPQLAFIARLTRANLIDTLASPWIRTARAKGLSTWRILWRHAAKSALLPLLSYLGPATAAIITGSVVVEQIFGLPGIGRYFVQGALNRDYTLVMGVVLFYGTLIIVFNLLVDVAYAWLDPRIRHSGHSGAVKMPS